MSDRKILVPVDFSSESKAAIEYGRVFAKDSDAELMIVHVVDPGIQYLDGIGPVESLAGIERALYQLQPSDESVRVTHRLLEGPPADTILKTAEEENAEMIVMGTHGRSGLKRLVMGSVAETVVRKAHCPVLTLRHGAGASTHSAAAT